jgi:hypothetical protein
LLVDTYQFSADGVSCVNANGELATHLLANVDNLAVDVTLKFDPPLKGKVDFGTAFRFKGVVDSFVKDLLC